MLSPILILLRSLGRCLNPKGIDNYTINIIKGQCCAEAEKQKQKINWQMMSHSIYDMKTAGVLALQLYCFKTTSAINVHM